MPFEDLLRRPDELLELEPEDVAPILLEYLSRAPRQEMSRYNFISTHCRGQDQSRFQKISEAIVEAWIILEREGLIAPQPESQGIEWVFITRRGRSFLQQGGDLRAYLHSNLLPPHAVNAKLGLKVRPLFLRGDYDTAVFAAFKELEIRVREGAALDADTVGVALMRAAFDAKKGALRESSLPLAEREAMAHLFAGAMGLFKNPSSHRPVSYGPQAAAVLIRLADYLINLTEEIMAFRDL